MIYSAHRINSHEQLIQIPTDFGIEVDLRDDITGNIYLAHDPFTEGEQFETFLQHYRHRFIILNIKNEGIEHKILELLKKYNINDYLFLDSSFPMIVKLSQQGVSNIAVRYSEYEHINTVLSLQGKVSWVWIDCFSKWSLTREDYQKLKQAEFKLCLVSPELQGRSDQINEFRDIITSNQFEIDMICTKYANIPLWKSPQIVSPVQIVIPMSGVGQRFIDAGYDIPKPLIEVDGKPMIEHVVNLFPNEYDFHFICNSHHLETTNMRQILKTVCPQGVIHEIPSGLKLGPVYAVSLVVDSLDDNRETIVSYCDYGSYWNYTEFLSDTRTRLSDGAIACYRGFHPHMLGTDQYAFLKETSISSRWMAAIQEKKPFTDNRMSEYASNGTYYFKSGKTMKKYFRQLIDLRMTTNGEYYVSSVYNLMVRDQLRVNIFEIEHMLQWGTPYDLQVYQMWSEYFSNVIKQQQDFVDLWDTATLLPMAGAGQRFTTRGYDDPKPLLTVTGKPMIVQAVNSIPKSSSFIFICLDEHNTKYQLADTLRENYPNCSIVTINEVTKGQACTCEIGLEATGFDLERPILISACDNGVYYDVDKYTKLVNDPNIDIIVWSFRNNPTSKNNPNMYAWLDVDDNDNIKSVSCKRFIGGDPLKTHAIIGTMFFRKARYFIEGLRKNYAENIMTNGEFYVDDVLNQNIKSGLTVKVFEVKNYICWGTPDDYETFVYWQNFFDKCQWHPYSKSQDCTNG